MVKHLKYDMCTKFIINADDLGLNPIVNKAIDDAFSKNEISSSTIMANSDYLDEVMNIVSKYPNVSFGCHLTLTEGRSISNNKLFYDIGFVDDSGCFLKSNAFLIKDALDEALLNAIKEEWDEQLTLLEDRGVHISHVDGHHHCHTWKGLESVLLGVLNKHNLCKVRAKYRYPILKEISLKRRILGKIGRTMLKSGLYNAYNHKKTGYINSRIIEYQNIDLFDEILLKNNKIRTIYFGEYKKYYELKIAHQIILGNNSTIELMCHPGHPNYLDEMRLVSENAIGIGQETDSIMITYNDL